MKKHKESKKAENAQAPANPLDSLVMWRACMQQLKAVRVTCPDGLWPHRDSEDVAIFNNTHFKTEQEAWDRIEAEMVAWIRIAGSDVRRAEEQLRKMQDAAGEASKEYNRFYENKYST